MKFRQLWVVRTVRLAFATATMALAVVVMLGGCGKEDPSTTDDTASKPQSIEQPNLAADSQLCDSCLKGEMSAVLASLDEGARVNALDEQGHTALMLAAFDGHHEIVRLLLDRGAKAEESDHKGFTALILAASGPSPKTVELLLDHGVEVNTRERTEGFTALMFAAAEGQLDNVKLLLRHGADPSLTDVDGDSAADFAQQNGHAAIAKLLSHESTSDK